MKKKSQNYLLTGIFVSLGILLFGITVYTLSSDENFLSQRSRLHSYFTDTQGLMFGSVVSFSGITIGNVKSITYDEKKEALRVEFSVKNSFLPFIKVDSFAQPRTQGALGDRYVFLSAGTPSSPSIKAGGEVPSKTPDDIFAAVQEKIDAIPNLDSTFKKLESLIDFLNSEEGLVGNSKELKLTLKELRTTLKNINSGENTKESLEKLNSILGKIDSGQGTLGRMVTDPSLYNKINSLFGGKSNSSGYLKKLMEKTVE